MSKLKARKGARPPVRNGRQGRPNGKAKATVSVHTFRDDPLYPRIARAVDQQLARGKVVTPIDVLISMGLLTPAHLEDWRRGRVPHLEKVINCNLTRLSRILRILRFHAHDLNLIASMTAYMRWSKGPKARLRFTKTGDPGMEQAYPRHFVWPGKGPCHPPTPKQRGRSGEVASPAAQPNVVKEQGV